MRRGPYYGHGTAAAVGAGVAALLVWLYAAWSLFFTWVVVPWLVAAAVGLLIWRAVA